MVEPGHAVREGGWFRAFAEAEAEAEADLGYVDRHLKFAHLRLLNSYLPKMWSILIR